MARLFGLESQPPQFAPARTGDVAWSKADIARAASVLGYRPLVSFEDGLAATVHWYQNAPPMYGTGSAERVAQKTQ
jgi:UDP-glucose 4-epimerase